jgi:hypothetical protein
MKERKEREEAEAEKAKKKQLTARQQALHPKTVRIQ